MSAFRRLPQKVLGDGFVQIPSKEVLDSFWQTAVILPDLQNWFVCGQRAVGIGCSENGAPSVVPGYSHGFLCVFATGRMANSFVSTNLKYSNGAVKSGPTPSRSLLSCWECSQPSDKSDWGPDTA